MGWGVSEGDSWMEVSVGDKWKEGVFVANGQTRRRTNLLRGFPLPGRGVWSAVGVPGMVDAFLRFGDANVGEG